MVAAWVVSARRPSQDQDQPGGAQPVIRLSGYAILQARVSPPEPARCQTGHSNDLPQHKRRVRHISLFCRIKLLYKGLFLCFARKQVLPQQAHRPKVTAGRDPTSEKKRRQPRPGSRLDVLVAPFSTPPCLPEHL